MADDTLVRIDCSRTCRVLTGRNVDPADALLDVEAVVGVQQTDNAVLVMTLQEGVNEVFAVTASAAVRIASRETSQLDLDVPDISRGVDGFFVFESELWSYKDEARGAVNLGPLLRLSSYDSRPQGFVALDRERSIFVAARDEGVVIARTDGTSDGTVALAAFGSASIDPEPRNGRLYFLAQTPQLGTELWSTDGETVGLVVDLVAGPGSGFNGFFGGGLSLIRLREALFTVSSRSLLRVEAGAAIAVSSFPGFLRFLGVADDQMMFLVQSDEGSALWASDGTELGTRRLVTKVHPSLFVGFVAFGELFLLGDGVPLQVWRDQELKILSTLPEGSLQGIAECGTSMYLITSGPGGVSVLDFDGSDQLGTVVRAENVGSDRPRSARVITTCFDDALYLSAYTEADGIELWRVIDGRFELAADLNPGPASSGPANFHVVNGRLLFTAFSAANGRELYLLASHTGTPRIVAELREGPGSSQEDWATPIPTLGAAGDFLVFSGATEKQGTEIWSVPLAEVGIPATPIRQLAGGGCGCRAHPQKPAVWSLLAFGSLIGLLIRSRRRC